MTVKTYDPKQVTLIVGGKIISGFSDGTFIKAKRNDQAFALKVGVDGEGTRAKSSNRSGQLEITLMNSSDSNDALNAFALLDETANAGAVPVLLKDGSGRTLASAVTAWVQKLPDWSAAKEAFEIPWVLETDELIFSIGGN